jgi:feruloyl-CoA synthase
MDRQTISTARSRPIAYAPVDVVRARRGDGATLLRARADLGVHDPSLARMFRRTAEARPDRLFLAERDATGAWRGLRYGQARRQVDAVAQALLDRGLSAEQPVVILSGNAIEHAVMMLAGFTAGVPVAPISVAYSLQSRDHAKLRHIARLLTPGLVYVSDTGPFASALQAFDAEIVAGENGAKLARVTAFADLSATRAGELVERSVAATDAATIAKFLFTSGSTGFPKAVINTHGMLAANQQALAAIWPFVADDDLTLVDWLPWNHTFGGNHNFNLVLRHAGTLHIDAGKPMPGLIEASVRNLAEVSPTIYFNVPAGFAALLPFLETDAALARSFFARLRLIFYAGAALPQDLWQRLEAVAIRTTGQRVPMTSSWGSTETAPLATAAHLPIDRAGVIGVPVPGVELKLVPSGGKQEVRVRGPHVTPGYWRSPDQTAAAFDEEGFYRIGDAVRFDDPDMPGRGLVFDGRIAEDFKLGTGTWVHVGALRVAALAAASPVLQDALVAGEGRDAVGLLAWPSVAGCKQLIGPGAPDDLPALAAHPAVRAHVRERLAAWNAGVTGASQRIGRVLLLTTPPSIDANEITDKGYVNQRAGLALRSAELDRLFAPMTGPEVIEIA